MKSKLANIPWVDAFLPSKILVAGLDDKGDIVAVCGIRSVFNISTLYVRGGWRGRGIGSKILRKTIDIAQKRHLSFILIGVFYDNVRAFRLASKFGFEEVIFLKKPSLRIMMLTMNLLGKIAYLSLRTITSSLPNLFWVYIAQFVHNVTVSSIDDKSYA